MAKPAALANVELTVEKNPPTGKTPETVDELQAAVEGVPVVDQITFMGDTYRITDKVGLMPLMKFAHSTVNADVDDLQSLADVYVMIRDCIDPADWDRFERDAIDKKAEGDDLLAVVTQTIAIRTARPTRRPSDSSAGPPSTSASSTGSSPSPDTRNGQSIEKLYTVDELIRQAGG